MSSRPPPPVIATRVPSSYPLYLTNNRFRRGPLPVTVVGPDGTNVPVASRDTYYSGQHEPFYPTATADHPNAYSGAYSAYNTYSGAYGPPASGNGDYIQSAFPLEVYFPSVLFTQNDRPRARLKSSRSYDHDTRMLEGCGRVVKYSLFVANLVIMLGGMVVFSVGAWTLADRSFMERLLGTDLYVSSAAILIATGCIVTFVSLLGCLGAFKEIKCMLLTFFVILFMLFIVMMVGGILGYVFRNEVDERMYQEMLMSIPIYKNDSVVTKAWDAVQRHFKCCGIPGPIPNEKPYRIWLQNAHFNDRNMQVPDSCCMRSEWLVGCRGSPSERDTYMDNCHTRVRDFVKGHAKIVGGVGIGIACLLVVGMALSCAMFLMIQ